MANEREAMLAALQAVLVPELRARGFRGRMPHFRRLLAERIDLLTIQFDKNGGGFVAEIAKCPPDGVRHSDGSWIAPERVTAHHLARRRRLGATAEDGDHWFRYGGLMNRLRGEQRFTQSAQAVVGLLDQQAEVWWRDA